MIPGLARGPPFPSKAKKGAQVAIATNENPSVPLVIGTCEIDVSALTEVRGVKGHAVQGVHWDGDEIWSWNPSGKPGCSPPDNIEGWYGEDDGLSSLAKGVESLAVEDTEAEEGGVTLEKSSNEYNDFVDGEDVEPHELVSVGKVWSTKGTKLFLMMECRADLIHRNRRCIPQSIHIRNVQCLEREERGPKAWH